MPQCPYCAEAIPVGETCPACGERLDQDDRAAPPPAGSKLPLIIGLVVGAFFLLICVVGILATLLMPALMKAKEKASRTRCSSNLRQLALAAIMYVDDKRFFPHVRGAQELDGDVTTGDTPRIVRSFTWFGYHDDPEGFICPSSLDQHVPVLNPATRANMRTWFWDGQTIPEGAQPPILDGHPDPALDSTYELSYGWTRRSLNASARSTTILGADRAMGDKSQNVGNDALVGNHVEGVNLAQADGSVSWATRATSDLSALTATSSTSSDGYLCIEPIQ